MAKGINEKASRIETSFGCRKELAKALLMDSK